MNPAGATRHAGSAFPAEPAAVPDARHALTAALRRWGHAEADIETSEPVAAELLSNAIRYGAGATVDLDVHVDA